MSTLKKNVAGQNVTFGLVSATTGAADPSATVTIYVVKDNGAQATGTGTVTNAGNGQYNYAPTQAETNATCVGFSFQATGDIPVFYNFLTDIVDANGLTSVNAADIGGSASIGAAGYVGIDWAHVDNPTTAVALTNTTISAGSNPTAAEIATAVWQDDTAGDFTVANSVGKSLYNAFEADSSVFTTASLVNAPTGGSAPTVAEIATAVWQDTTSGDFTVAGSVGLGLFLRGAAPGSAGGLFLSGAGGILPAASITAAAFAPFAEGYTVLGTTSTYTLPNLMFDIHRALYARSIGGSTESILGMDGATVEHTLTLTGSPPTAAVQAT